MAAELASRLFQSERIDLVLCFAPSCQVVEGFRSTFFKVLGRRLDGLIGAIGDACTYQAMEFQAEEFWLLLENYRVLAVFDEIHHCAGNEPIFSNAWGQQIIQKIQDRAVYTLALSGTPWRSDDKGVTLARYSTNDDRLICDYRYGLLEAISDKVCRSPRIVLLDNHAVRFKEDSDSTSSERLFPSFNQLLCESPVSYENLLRHPEIISQMLDLATSKLDQLRLINSNAGGLVVATDIEHAHQIASAFEAKGELCRVVTNRDKHAQARIDEFRNDTSRWIVAVGMISEGTDIPRLQVCCYLSRIRTELHYRQVLGRVLRRTGSTDDQAWLYVLAESTLEGFSQRVADDLPEDLAILSRVQIMADDADAVPIEVSEPSFQQEYLLSDDARNAYELALGLPSSGPDAASAYQLSFSQRYHQQLLALF